MDSAPHRPTPIRPPGLEFGIGLALFAVVLLVFSQVQTAVLIAQAMARSTAHAGQGFSLGLLTDPAFRALLRELSFNGDVVARVAIWSGIAGLALLLAGTHLWKRGRTAHFLGLHRASPRQFLRWTALLVLMALLVEGLAHLFPAFRTDFMERVIGSSTNTWSLVLGVGIVAPVFEEFLLRGLLLGALRHLMGEHVSVALTAGLFAVMHIGQYPLGIVLLIVPMGVVFGYARTRTGSIWAPVLLHVLNNLLSIALH